MQINWTVSTQEAAYIINALAEKPFKDVNTLIGKLHAETTKQIAEIEAGKNGDSNKRE